MLELCGFSVNLMSAIYSLHTTRDKIFGFSSLVVFLPLLYYVIALLIFASGPTSQVIRFYMNRVAS